MPGDDGRPAPPQMTPITCPNCGISFRLHPPVLTFKVTPDVSAYFLTPSWAPAERRCRCGLFYVPLLPPEAMNGRIIWAAISHEEPSPIVKPNMVLPPNFNPRG